MAIRITTYKQAFESVLGIKITDRVTNFISALEREGHTEKSICFTIWKSQSKLLAFKHDERFWGVFRNEIKKWSWGKKDKRWNDYKQRKLQEQRAETFRKEINNIQNDFDAIAVLNKNIGKKRISHIGYVYFIQGQCGGAIKIGYSMNPTERLKELQTGYPDTLKILLIIPGDLNTEKALHRKFEGSRLKGEWFRPDDYLISTIKEFSSKLAVN